MLITLFAACIALGVQADVGPVGRSASEDNLGSIKGVEKWFITAKNTTGSAVENGRVMIMDVAEDDGFSVKASTDASQVPVCIMDEACADDAQCRCQTYGLKTDVDFDASNGSAVAGRPAFISETSLGAVWYEASPAATDIPVGIFYDADSASGEVELMIKLR
jgi:hypothetical protein